MIFVCFEGRQWSGCIFGVHADMAEHGNDVGMIA